MSESRARLEQFTALFERFDPTRATEIERLYAPDAIFTDPWGTTRGRGNIVAHFVEQYARHADNRCHVRWSTVDGKNAALLWRLELRRDSGETEIIEGMTHLRFGPDGIELHRDYYGTFPD